MSIRPGKSAYTSLLVGSGANINIVQPLYGSPFLQALRLQCFDTAQLVLENVADPLLGTNSNKKIYALLCKEEHWNNHEREKK